MSFRQNAVRTAVLALVACLDLHQEVPEVLLELGDVGVKVEQPLHKHLHLHSAMAEHRPLSVSIYMYMYQ